MAPSEKARHWSEHRMPTVGAAEARAVYHGTVVCGSCHAIWNTKHWHLDEEEYARLSATPTVAHVTCPACRLIAEGLYDGRVILRSSLIAENRHDFLGLIRNVERETRMDNPLARLALMVAEGDLIEVRTITAFLAERIGKEMKKAYHGDLTIERGDAQGIVYVNWRR